MRVPSSEESGAPDAPGATQNGTNGTSAPADARSSLEAARRRVRTITRPLPTSVRLDLRTGLAFGARASGAPGCASDNESVSLIRRFLGRSESTRPAGPPGHVMFLASGLAETGDGLIWAGVSTSPDERYAILTRDGDDRDEHFGHRDSGPGRYRLIEKDVGMLCEGRLERPNDAHVADNGTFVVADWLFTDALAGRFHVFARDSRSLVTRDYRANVLYTFVSPEGRYAAVQLASNPDDPTDDERFSVFDLSTGTELWSKPLEVGRPKAVAFRADGVLEVESEGFGRAEYGLTDGSVDAKLFRAEALANGSGFAILSVVEAELKEGVAEEQRPELVAACERAVVKLKAYPHHEARARRFAGELVAASDPVAALRYWDEALRLDPKVGIAKRAAALRTLISRR